MPRRIIHLHALAPAKPPAGAACNGCGVCCAAATCPLARLLLRQWHGPCRALQWDAEARRYRCGMLLDPCRRLPWLPGRCGGWLARLARRWIAAGAGCDSDAEVEPL